MRVLFVTAPFKSHLYVQVPLASALRTAGHQVRVAGAPDMADTIAATGLTGVPIGEVVPLNTEMTAAANDLAVLKLDPDREKALQPDYARDEPHAELTASIAGVRRLFSPDSFFDDIVAFARRWRPDLVVWDTFMYPGAVAARACGAASARILFGVDGHGQLRVACGAPGGRGWPEGLADPMREWLEPMLARFGAGYDDDVVMGDWTIFPMPPWIWRPPGVPYVPVRHVPYHGPAKVPAWLRDEPPGRPRICVTLGMSHRDKDFGVEASARAVFDAVADLDVDVVATLNAKQLGVAPAVPDNVTVADFVPLNVLLPGCSAILHSGGAGTFAAGIEHAVPQLIVPNTYFSERWWGPVAMANGLEDRGAGVYVADADQLTADGLRKDLLRVLEEPSFAANAARVRNETLGMPTPNDLVPVLEKLTRATKLQSGKATSAE
jgi:glycosyltransferase (activator-dependent family)